MHSLILIPVLKILDVGPDVSHHQRILSLCQDFFQDSSQTLRSFGPTAHKSPRSQQLEETEPTRSDWAVCCYTPLSTKYLIVVRGVVVLPANLPTLNLSCAVRGTVGDVRGRFLPQKKSCKFALGYVLDLSLDFLRMRLFGGSQRAIWSSWERRFVSSGFLL